MDVLCAETAITIKYPTKMNKIKEDRFNKCLKENQIPKNA